MKMHRRHKKQKSVAGWSLYESKFYPAREQNALWTLSAASAFATISLAFGWIMNALEPFIWSRSGDTVHVYYFSSCLAIHPFFFVAFLGLFFNLCLCLNSVVGPFCLLKRYRCVKGKRKEVRGFSPSLMAPFRALLINRMNESNWGKWRSGIYWPGMSQQH